MSAGRTCHSLHLHGLVRAALLLIALGLFCRAALADTMPSLFSSFAGNVNFVGTHRTLRTGDNTSNATASALVSGTTTASGSAATTATLSGLPSTGTNTIRAAYLYWAGSGATADNTVTFEGTTVTASRTYTITNAANIFGMNYFSGVADVTSLVAAKGNGTYTFSGLTANNGEPWVSSQAVLAGWALLVVYENPTVERFRVLNVYEGFQPFYGSNIPLTISNFRTPNSNIDGRLAHLTWEGDVTNSTTLNGFTEQLTFNNVVLTDSNNPSSNQFNSVSTIRTVDNASYGIDFDIYDVSAYMTAGSTSATSVYSSGADLVLLSMEVISVTNTPVADLAIAMTGSGTMFRGQNATYTITVSNNGPNSEAGPIRVTDTLPSGLTFVAGTGTNWSCSASGQAVTCIYNGGNLDSGNSTPPLTLTTAVSASATGTISNSATVAGTSFDNVSGNNTATVSQSVAIADLAIAMTRGSALFSGRNTSYTLSVSNGGPNTETGPISVTNTLPSGFSFVSGSGTGWSCSASGQEVTCTYSGSLSSGATAPSISLIATVGGSGSVTNTATVTGTQRDTNTANNTASDTSTVLPAPYAYYGMNESAWSGAAGTVLDGSGNARHATALGSISTVTAPASGLKPDTCRAGNIPANTSEATVQAVDTGYTINSLGTAGTISFWYKSNVAWVSSGNANDRTLIDATGSAVTREFWLVLRQNGALQFNLDNSGGTAQSASGTAQSFAQNTWHHIAITWDFSGTNTMAIYVDGALNGSRTHTNVTANANYGTIYIGDSKSNRYTNPNRGNSANGVIDEVRIYSGALTAAQVAADMNIGQTCVDHYELSLATSSVTCLATTVKVTACADSSSPCTNKYAGVSGTTAVLGTTGGTLAATTVAFDSTGEATTTLSHPSATNGTTVSVTLSGEQVIATNPRKCCPDGLSCAAGNSCSTVFSTASFILSNTANGDSVTIANQFAGKQSATYYLRAIRTNPTTKACESALAGTQPVDFAYQCNNPTTCYTPTAPTCANPTGCLFLRPHSGTTPQSSMPVAANNNGTTPGNYTSVTMTFDADGNAPFDFNFKDVGQVTLWMRKNRGGNLLSDLAGSSNAFVVKPHHFDLSDIKRTSGGAANPGAADASKAKFVQAGESFTLTVKALNAEGSATPNFGRESPPQGVRLTHELVAPANGVPGTLSNNVIAGNQFNAGTATVNNLAWSEVGIIQFPPKIENKVTGKFTPSVIFDNAGEYDYLGAGKMDEDAETTGATGNIGRFYPSHFVATTDFSPTSATVVRRPGCTPDSSFTYMRESMQVTQPIAAKNTSNDTTMNYTGSFAKLDGAAVWAYLGESLGSNVSSVVLSAVDGTTALSTRLEMSDTTISWANGEGTLGAKVKLNRLASNNPDGPYDNLEIGIAPTDSDGVTLMPGALNLDADRNNTPETLKILNTKVRFGRIRLANAHGSELLPLTIPIRAEFFRTGVGFVTSTDDNCTTFTLTPVASTTPGSVDHGNLLIDAAKKNMTVTASTPTLTNSSLTGGRTNIRLSAPGAGKNGSVDLRLTVPEWLQFTWGDKSNPGARATFGAYRGNNEFIYMRENY